MTISKMKCCNCGCAVRLPITWMLGIEIVFKCPKCAEVYKTGYKMGAVLFALSLMLALVTVQIVVFLLSSLTLPVVVVLAIPLWLLYGILFRRAWMLYRCRRRLKSRK